MTTSAILLSTGLPAAPAAGPEPDPNYRTVPAARLGGVDRRPRRRHRAASEVG